MQWWLNQQHTDEHWCFTDNLFSSEECDNIVELLLGGKVNLQEAVVGDENGKVDKNIRDSTIGWVPTDQDTNWIFQKLTDGILSINKEFSVDNRSGRRKGFSNFSRINPFII